VKKILILIAFCLLWSFGFSQSKRVAYLTTYDQDRLHFGFTLGLNAFDFRIRHFNSLNDNVDFSTQSLDSLKLAEIDAVDRKVRADVATLIPGFTVGIVSSYRLSEFAELRFLPGLSFGNRKMVFNVPIHDLNNNEDLSSYSVRSTYLDFPLVVKYKAKRIVNQRPYIVLGGAFRLDIAKSADDDLVALDSPNLFFEIGGGWDSYLPYFRFSTELKFSFGLNNVLGKIPEFPQPAYYSNAISRINSNIITLSFHFE